MNWRTCKRMEAELIRDYFEWMREYQEQTLEERAERERYEREERAERERYERARNAADRAAGRY